MSMDTFRRLMPLVVLLWLLMARSALAQGDGQIVAGAHTSGAPNVIGFADSAQGSAVSNDVAQATVNQFSDTDWAFFDDGTLVIGKNAQPILITGYLISEDKQFFLFHRRDKKFSIHGTVLRDRQDPKQGQAEFWYAVFADDGTSASTSYVLVNLTFVQ
jgi:hypothetical protein